MKKFTYLIPFLFLSLYLNAQEADSTFLHQIDSLDEVARSLAGEQQFDKALEINKKAKDLILEKLGKENLHYGKNALQRGRLLTDAETYPEAEAAFREAEEILEKTVGRNHQAFANNLNSLGHLYLEQGQSEKAEPLFLEALDILGQLEESEAHVTEDCLSNLADLYNKNRRLEEVFSVYSRLLEHKEKTIGKVDPSYCGTLTNIGSTCRKLGRYEESESFYKEALDIFENQLQDTDHHFYANALNNLGVLYFYMGRYEESEPLKLKVKEMREKKFGKEHPEYANSVNNLANLYDLLGNFEEAERLHKEALEIRRKILGEKHPDYGWSLSNLATLYFRTGQYDKAEPLYLQCMEVWKESPGENSPQYGMLLQHLAGCYYLGGQDMEKARTYLEQSMEIFRNSFGEKHPIYAKGINNMAEMYFQGGDYEKAEQMYLEARAIRREIMGEGVPDYITDDHYLGRLYWTMGKQDKAAEHIQTLVRNTSGLIISAQHHLSEQELFQYIDLFSERQYLLYSFARSFPGEIPDILKSAYDNSLFYKGFLLNSINHFRRLAAESPEIGKKFDELRSQERHLSESLTAPPARRDSGYVAALQEDVNRLEKEIAGMAAGYREALRQVSWQEVQAQLQAGEAAVEFVRYQLLNPDPVDSIFYAALILQAGGPAPHFIPLAEEDQLKALLSHETGKMPQMLNELYGEEKASPLYDLIWEPMDKHFKEVNTIYFSPAGLLHRLNLAAIKGKNEKRLDDRYRLIRLNSTRELVEEDEIDRQHSSAILFGGIQYDADEIISEPGELASRSKEESKSRGSSSFSQVSPNLRGDNWNYLQWTDIEVDAIDLILEEAGFRRETKKGYAASESYFKSIGKERPSPQVLHLATHGFFFPDPETARGASSLSMTGPLAFKSSEHPMIRSGLVLAGGNYAWETGEPLQPGEEDGILTALEISQMDLSNTELVVLSACETGLGDIRGYEGVYGLQRAFKIAGAKYLIMSLWQVPDFQTQELMSDFYAYWLEEGMNIPDAFRAARKALREAYPDTINWAGFILFE